MGIRNFTVISIGENTSVHEDPSGAAGSVAIPSTASGNPPKFLRIKTFGGSAGADLSVTPATSAGNGVFATGMVMASAAAGSSQILNVHGFSFIRYDVGTVTDGKLCLTPLEDF